MSVGEQLRVEEVSAGYLVTENEAVVPVGYKKTDVGVIPEDWDVVRLIDVATFGGGTTPSRKLGNRYFDGFHPWVKTLDLNNGVIQETEECVTDQALAETCLQKHKAGSILIAMYGGFNQIGRTGMLAIDAAINQALVAIKPEIKKLSSSFLLANLNYHVDYWKSVASSSRKDPNITSNDVKNYTLGLPKIEEQTAIATALSDVDALIEDLDQLITKKRNLKQATIQQLLTGKTRLPEFALREDGTPKGYKQSELGEIPEDWNVRQLRSMLNEPPKYGINAPAVPLKGDLPVYIRITDINEEGYFRPSERVGVASVSSIFYQLTEGAIVVARTGASVGKSYLYRKEDGELVYAGFLIKIACDAEQLLPGFLFQYMKSNNYWNWVALNSMRSGQPGINGNEYGSLLIPAPDVEEQGLIAKVLLDMDEEILALEQRRTKTQLLKQGMMQELLTGKTRLIKPELTHGQ